ncbi:MAG: hypothetical protein AAFO94_08045 [Bacteroidota bacterium]
MVKNAIEVDANRYADIKGSPYLFKGWATATLVGTRGEKTEGIKINYNGFNGEFEVLVDGKHITLETNDYKRIFIIPPGSGRELLFKRGLHMKYANKFPQVIYEGDDMVLIKEFIVTKSKQKIESVGKTIEVERFGHRHDYWLLKNNELTVFKPRKKDVIRQLGGSEALASFIKKEKLDLKKEADLQKLFNYYETL